MRACLLVQWEMWEREASTLMTESSRLVAVGAR